MKNIMFCMDNVFITIGIGCKTVINKRQDKVKNSAVLYYDLSLGNHICTGKKRK